jgi:SAM-dependent methyltransferase
MKEANPWDQVWQDCPPHGPFHSIGVFLSRWGELKRLILSEVRRSGALTPNGYALEAGCGTGTVMGLVAGHGVRVVGVDLSRHAVLRAKAHSSRLAVARVENLPFPDGTFNLVYSSGVFDLLSDQDLYLAVREALRVTTPGGRVILICAAPCGLHRRVRAYLEKRNRWRYGPKREVSSLKEVVLSHRPDATVTEYCRGFVQQLRFPVYIIEHRKFLRRLAHGVFLLLSILFWPLNRFPGAVLVTRVSIPGESH